MSASSNGARALFVDTSAFAAAAVAGDQWHRRAVEITNALARRGQVMITTNFVVAETHALVLSRAGRVVALRVFERMTARADRVVRVTNGDEQRAREILMRFDDKDFSYTDATSFAVMERLGLTQAFTFDRHFAQFGVVALGADGP